jgi:hypothetical protein
MKFIPLILATTTLLFFNSCKKNDCPSTPESIQLNSNDPIYEGWPLYLWTENSSGYTYHWQGPNGWSKDYDYFTNMAGSETIDSMTPAKAGIYIVNLMENDCVLKQGKRMINVIPVPSPPCSVNNNSSTSTVIGIGGLNYTYVSGYASGSTSYNIQASSGSQALNFTFKGGQIPLPGVYKSETNLYPSEQSKVCISIGTTFQEYDMKPGYDVYVNKVNGNTVISFCAAGFYNPTGSTTVTVSGKVTLP